MSTQGINMLRGSKFSIDQGILRRQHILKSYMKQKQKQRQENFYSPDEADKYSGLGKTFKYLVICACHCNSELKLQGLMQTLPFFNFACVDLVVINSENLEPFSSRLVSFLSSHLPSARYEEVANDAYIDFGKWVKGMKMYGMDSPVRSLNYDYVVCINDSIILRSPIGFFLNMLPKANKALFGFNDSSQVEYHFQSYLFALSREACQQFMAKVEQVPKETLVSMYDAVMQMEIPMVKWFAPNCGVFLNLVSTGLNEGRNIFFQNDEIFRPLQHSFVLPIDKIKRIQQDQGHS